MANPVPVVRDGRGKLISSYKIRDWFDKLNEELNEVKVAVWDFENYACKGDYDEDDGICYVAEELQDLKTVCNSMLTWLNYEEKVIANSKLDYGLNSEKWINALDLYLDEVKTSDFNKGEKLLKLMYVCTAMQMRYCGLDKSEIDKICAKVSEKNEKRGYFNEE